MKRPGNHVCLWMLATFAAMAFLHPPGWVMVIAAFAVGWYYNEQERTRDA